MLSLLRWRHDSRAGVRGGASANDSIASAVGRNEAPSSWIGIGSQRIQAEMETGQHGFEFAAVQT
jgi:hypothetical protein